jgi:acyl transferase domain-containing protein
MDPQQRHFLEVAWTALEDAGHDPEAAAAEGHSIGVFGATGASHHWVEVLMTTDIAAAVGGMQVALGNEKDFLPTKVAYKLGLTGPGINVQTACSSALVAVHLACQSLLGGECDTALAGGVSVNPKDRAGYPYEEDGIVSPDGHCRPFDARGQGTVPGHGVGVVVLKRLADALADGDRVRAVVRGSALNNDGGHKVGFTAPAVEGQAAVIAQAHAVAGIEATDLDYIEAHGTATPLGDPIEAAALARVFGGTAPEGGASPCALGSVKSNIGHLNAAAGIAGFIKTVLALEHGEIPPSLHFETLNPQIDFSRTPLYVNTALQPWPERAGAPKRAAVSSFGLGGTNAHVVLEAAPAVVPSAPSRDHQLLLWSAASETALEGATDRLAEHLAPPGAPLGVGLADVAFTLQRGRRRLPHRRFLVTPTAAAQGAAAALARRDPKRLRQGVEERRQRGVAFLLPGVGDHYPGMTAALYRDEPTFRAALDTCAEILQPLLGEDLRSLLYPTSPEGEAAATSAGKDAPKPDLKKMLGRGAGQGERSAAEARLDATRFAQPAVFAVEYALAQLLAEWGVVPEALLGYSLGEYTAACLAGVLPLEGALKLVAERARLIDELPAGAMVAVPLGEAETAALLQELGLTEALDIAAVTAPAVTVVAGPVATVATLEERLQGRELVARRLPATHAFHSRMLEPAAAPLRQLLAGMALAAPKIPVASNVTGDWLTAEEATDPEYWVRHLLGTVRFTEGVGRLLEGDRVLLEVGPGQSLATAARQHPEGGGRDGARPILTTVRDAWEGTPDLAHLLETVGRLWLAGVALDGRGFTRHETRQRVALPTYAFDREEYRLPQRAGALSAAAAAAPQDGAATAPRGRGEVGEWFYTPVWPLTSLPPALPSASEAREDGEAATGATLLFFRLEDAQDGGLASALTAHWEAAGQRVLSVYPGARFAAAADGARFEVPADDGPGYDALLAALREDPGGIPQRIVHGWSADRASMEGADDPSEGAATGVDDARFAAAQTFGVGSVVHLAQALARAAAVEPRTVTVLTRGLHAVDGGEALRPERATLVGALKVIPQEYPDLRLRNLDLGETLPAALVAAVAAEILFDGTFDGTSDGTGPETADQSPADAAAAAATATTVAYRASGRRVQHYEPVRLGPGSGAGVLRPGGVYLLTGGLGRIGIRLAEHLLNHHGARVALVGRRAPSEAMQHHLQAAALAAGNEILLLTADVADAAALRGAVEQTRAHFGALHGVIHLAGAVASSGGLQVHLEATDQGALERHFPAKVAGVYALEAALAALDETPEGAEELDFVLLFSSLATVLGGLGFTAYTAANAFLDAFAHAHNQRHRRRGSDGAPWFAADWDGWPLEAVDPEGEPQPFVMTPTEAVDAFERILALRHASQVVVALGDLPGRLRDWVERGSERDGEGARAATADLRPRPPFATPYVAPEGEVQEGLAALWGEMLGVAGIGVHDDFFELGGDSLVATQMLARARRRFRTPITLRDLFAEATIAGLAAVVEGGGDDGLEDLEELLGRIEGLEDDDLEALEEDEVVKESV